MTFGDFPVGCTCRYSSTDSSALIVAPLATLIVGSFRCSFPFSLLDLLFPSVFLILAAVDAAIKFNDAPLSMSTSTFSGL